jgi:hypothetical protein
MATPTLIFKFELTALKHGHACIRRPPEGWRVRGPPEGRELEREHRAGGRRL